MQASSLILREEDHRRIVGLVERLLEEANGRLVALVDRNGQPLALAGNLPGVDQTALASLAAGNVAATEGLARMIGERTFLSMYHEGDEEHLYYAAVGETALLVVVFDARSSLGLVRLRVRQVAPEIATVLEEARQATRAGALDGAGGPLAEITDEDIDKLFSDGF